MPEQKDKQQLMSLFGTLMQAKDTPEQGENAQSSYYAARKEYERERLKTAILAPVIGGIFSDLISAPFREPLMNFQATEKGAKLYADYKNYSDDYNLYNNRRNSIRASGSSPDEFFFNEVVTAKEASLKDIYGDNWRDDPRVHGAFLDSYIQEARDISKIEGEQYALAEEMFQDGYMSPQEFQVRVERYNPLPSGPGQAFSRWMGRLFRGETKEEYTDKMINQITGGPDSPLGIDHNVLSDLVHNAVFIDNKNINEFRAKAYEHYAQNIAPDELLNRELQRGLYEESTALKEVHSQLNRIGNTRDIVFQSINEILRENDYGPESWKYLNNASVQAKLEEVRKLPSLTTDDREYLRTYLASTSLYDNWEKLRDDVNELHPVLSGDTYSDTDKETLASALFTQIDNKIIDRAVILSERAMREDAELADRFTTLPTDNEKQAFMLALVESQIPQVYEAHLETYEVMRREGGLFGWGAEDVLHKIYTGELNPLYNLNDLEDATTNLLEPGATEATGGITITGDNLEEVRLLIAQNSIENRLAEDEEAFKRVHRDIGQAVNDLGGHPYIVPSQEVLQELIQSANRYTNQGQMLRDLVPGSIMGWPFGTVAEEHVMDDGSTVRITHERRREGTAGQFNISRTTEELDLEAPRGLYQPPQVKEVLALDTTLLFEDLPEDSLFRKNAMYSSVQYMANERQLIALGMSSEFLQEAYYRDHSFFAVGSVDTAKAMQADPTYSNALKQVDPENRERAVQLYKANKDILDRFDFSRIPFRTRTQHADQFLRDANEAYKKLNLGEEWTEDQIDEAGNIMSPPSLLEPDYEDASPEAKSIVNLLTDRHAFVVDDMGNPIREEAIAALMGNIHVETGNTFDYQQPQDPGKGYGLFQLDAKKANYDTWLEENDKQDSAASQIDFVYDTIYGESQDVIGRDTARELRDIFETGTVEQITTSFMRLWEKPSIEHLDRRIEAATNYFSIFYP